MKRFFSVILTAAVLCAALTGCGGSGSGGGSSASGGSSAGTGGSAAAADWPKSNIKIICPYTAGGGADLMARTVAPQLADMLGVSVTVENNTGGSGAVAMNLLASSKADGYTLVLTTVGAATLTPNSSDVGYTDAEFAPISQVSSVPNVFCVHKDLGVSTWEEYLALAEEKGNLTYGTSGAGLTQNVQVERMLAERDQTGLITHIPFDGGAASVTALLGQQVDATVNIVSECKPYIEDGTFIPLFVTEKSDDLPDVPTTADLGYEVQGGVWYGFAAPAGTDQAIIDRLDDCFAEIMQMDEVIETYENLGCPVVYLDSEDFTTQWKNDFQSNKEALAALNG